MADPTAAELGPYAAGILGLFSSVAAALRFSGRLSDVEAKVKSLVEAQDKIRAEVSSASNMGPSSVSGASLRAMVTEIVTAHLTAIRAEVSGALTSFRTEMERIRAEHERDRERGVNEWKEFYRLVGQFQRALKEKEIE